jgi:hypothetical protein
MAKSVPIVWHLDAKEVQKLQDQGKLDAVLEELKTVDTTEDITAIKKKIDDIINT